MTRLLRASAMALPLVALCAGSALADVKTRNRTQIHFEGMLGRMVGMFGGKAAKEGIETTTAVKGDRKVMITDTTERIVDLQKVLAKAALALEILIFRDRILQI